MTDEEFQRFRAECAKLKDILDRKAYAEELEHLRSLGLTSDALASEQIEAAIDEQVTQIIELERTLRDLLDRLKDEPER
jgi:hypothetical protein